MTRTPSSRALSSFEPGDSPTMRPVVFRVTDDPTSAPCASKSCSGLVPAYAGERPGDDEDLAGEGLGPGRLLGDPDFHSGLLEPAEELAVLGLGEEEEDAFGDLGADVLGLDELLPPRRLERREGPEARRQSLGQPLADVADAEGEEKAGEAARFRGLDLAEEVPGALRAQPFEGDEVLQAKGVKVGDGADELGAEELVDDGLAQPVDVHGPPAGEVEDGFPDAGRAGRVLAARDDLALGPEDLRAADRAVVGPGERPWSRGAAAPS